MLIKFTCKGMGLDCPFMVKGLTIEEVTRQAMEHVRTAHQQDFNHFTTQAQIEDMERALARSTRVVVS